MSIGICAKCNKRDVEVRTISEKPADTGKVCFVCFVKDAAQRLAAKGGKEGKLLAKLLANADPETIALLRDFHDSSEAEKEAEKLLDSLLSPAGKIDPKKLLEATGSAVEGPDTDKVGFIRDGEHSEAKSPDEAYAALGKEIGSADASAVRAIQEQFGTVLKSAQELGIRVRSMNASYEEDGVTVTLTMEKLVRFDASKCDV